MKFPKNGLVKMYLNSHFLDPVRMERLVYIAPSSFLPLIEATLQFTLPLSIISFIFGLVLAIFTALARISTVKIFQIIARVYVSFIRGTPLLVQFFILFYGLPTLGITIEPFPAA